jgi:hypothetical protein
MVTRFERLDARKLQRKQRHYKVGKAGSDCSEISLPFFSFRCFYRGLQNTKVIWMNSTMNNNE